MTKNNSINKLNVCREWYAEMERAKRKKKPPNFLTAIRKTFIKPYSFFGIILFFQCVGLK